MFTGIVGINTPVLCSSLVIVVITQVRYRERERSVVSHCMFLNYDSGSKYGNSHWMLKLKLCFHTAGSVVSVESVFMDTEVRRLLM